GRIHITMDIRPNTQYFLADRYDHVDRPGYQERHSYRGIRQSEKRIGIAQTGGGTGGIKVAPSPHPYDQLDDGTGNTSYCDIIWRRVDKPSAPGHSGGWRCALLSCTDLVCHTCYLFISLATAETC